jgi:shikimate kinase
MSAQSSTQPAEAATTTATPAPSTALSPSIRRILLTGFMGAGKSTIGRELAAQLGWTFLDLDRHLEQRTGSTIPALFELHGEPRFRRLESAALASTLALTDTVIALGGGTPEVHTNRLLIEQTPGTLTIFLDAPFPVLFDRCVLQALNPGTTDRPVLKDPVLAESRFRLRLPHYRRLARITQPTEDQTPTQTVAALLHRLGTDHLPR